MFFFLLNRQMTARLSRVFY